MALRSCGLGSAISIHALREEGDPTNLAAFADREIFLSTPSARRATQASQEADHE